MKRASSNTSVASTRSISSHSSLSDLLGSSINSLTLGLRGGANASFNAMVGATGHNSSSSTSSSSKGKLQHHEQDDSISTELCMSEFKDFLCHTLAKEVIYNSDDLDPLYELLEASPLLQDDLQDMEIALLSLLKSNPTLPSKVVGQVHTFLGMVYLELSNNTKAVGAFLRAIWFISRNSGDKLAIAKANHRLGLAYGRNKEYKRARDLLDRAIAAYDPNSAVYVLAKEDLHEVIEAQQLDLLAKSGRVSKAVVNNNAKSKRESRRKRVAGAKRDPGIKRQNSLNKGLTAAMTALSGTGKGSGLKRHGTAEPMSRPNEEFGVNRPCM